MDKIVVNFRPFTITQNVMVFVNGECKENAGATLDEMVSVINGLRAKYNIDEVDLCGSYEFLLKYKTELMTTQYSNNPVNVNIIDRR